MGAIREPLLAWFDERKRDLPWRGIRDPYRVWISEVMLQQTRADTVVPYYLNWLERFPDVFALAEAELDEVLGLWQGLGYYARARNAHRAARIIRDRHGGVFPATAAGLRALPGVGPYTAGAVASIAFGEAVTAVDGNVRRVVARLFDRADPSPAEARAFVSGVLDTRRPGDFNEALMELGATVCTPRSPLCPECPVEEHCRARARGTVAKRPLRQRRGKAPVRRWGVLVAVSPQGRMLVVRRPREGLLGGMWEFPSVGVDDGRGVEARVLGLVGNSVGSGAAGSAPSVRPGRAVAMAVTELAPVRHRFSHFTAVYRPFRVEVGEEWEAAAGRWVRPGGLADVALSAAQQRIARAALNFARPG